MPFVSQLAPVEGIPSYAMVIRCIWERGHSQREALAELYRRGLCLSEDQRKQAGLHPDS